MGTLVLVQFEGHLRLNCMHWIYDCDSVDAWECRPFFEAETFAFHPLTLESTNLTTRAWLDLALRPDTMPFIQI